MPVFKAGCSQKGICISERSCFALPLTVFSFCLKAELLHSAAKGADCRRQEAGASGFDHLSLCLCQPRPLPRGTSFKIQGSSKKKAHAKQRNAAGMSTHVCAHACKGKLGSIRPPGVRHLHQPGIRVNHPN